MSVIRRIDLRGADRASVDYRTSLPRAEFDVEAATHVVAPIIEAVARERIRVEEMVGGNDFPSVRIVDLPDGTDPTSEETLLRARGTFTAYRAAVAQMQGDPFTGTLPQDPEFLSWTLATAVPLPLAEKQELLEAEDPAVRLAMVTDFLREELRAINVIPSMPAVQVARTSWSPN